MRPFLHMEALIWMLSVSVVAVVATPALGPKAAETWKIDIEALNGTATYAFELPALGDELGYFLTPTFDQDKDGGVQTGYDITTETDPLTRIAQKDKRGLTKRLVDGCSICQFCTGCPNVSGIICCRPACCSPTFVNKHQCVKDYHYWEAQCVSS